MSAEARQYVEELLALAPWLAFLIAVTWCSVLELRDNFRASRAHEPEHLSRPEKRRERTRSTNT